MDNGTWIGIHVIKKHIDIHIYKKRNEKLYLYFFLCLREDNSEFSNAKHSSNAKCKYY